MAYHLPVLTFSAKLALYETALADAGALVTHAAASDLRLPTPCDEWDLAALLSHMIGQNAGFARAVAEGDAQPAAYHGPELAADSVVPLWNTSVSALRAAFAARDPQARIHLAEFDRDVTVAVALDMQLLDTAVHAWDVAASLRRSYRPDQTTAAFVLGYARQIAARPGGTPGVFAAALPETGMDPWLDALQLLGRRPQ
jgi:uncharacterized protein (TIGR03086 family)